MLAQAGLAVGSTLYLDIHRLGFYSDDITTWDNISVHPKEDAAPETAEPLRSALDEIIAEPVSEAIEELSAPELVTGLELEFQLLSLIIQQEFFLIIYM